ncbi:MAG: hypothetical protein ACI4I7_01315 [Oscillospiraceae bacterium]
MIKRIIDELTAYILAALLIWCCILLIRDQQFIHSDIILSVQRCINVIIPSLFAFMAFSGIIIGSKIYIYISKPFYPLSKYIFKMPNELFFIFLMGNISGYPIGAKLLVQMTEEHKISSKTASVLNCFCYGGGPAFFTGAIGLTVFSSSKIGLIIFTSAIISNTLIAVILNRIIKPKYTPEKQSVSLDSDCIVNSVISAGKSMFIICTTIIFFSVIISLLDSNGFFNILKSSGLSDNQLILIKSVLEISNLSELSGNSISLIPYVAGICSFGGICVLIQIKAIVGRTYSLKYFFISRILSSFLSGIICSLILRFYKPEVVTAAVANAKIVVQPNNTIPTLCLIAMIIIIFMHNEATKKAVRLKRTAMSKH